MANIGHDVNTSHLIFVHFFVKLGSRASLMIRGCFGPLHYIQPLSQGRSKRFFFGKPGLHALSIIIQLRNVPRQLIR